MKYIKCTCGELLALDYNSAERATIDVTKYFQWICRHCGNIVQEEQTEPFNLKTDVTEGQLTKDNKI